MRKYTESHEWIEVEEGVGTVGITDHAQSELGDIVYVELPQVGATIEAGEEVVVLESTKAAADVYSPVSGTIVEVNTQLEEAAELVNASAYSDGWLYKIELSDPSQLDDLMDDARYTSMVG